MTDTFALALHDNPAHVRADSGNKKLIIANPDARIAAYPDGDEKSAEHFHRIVIEQDSLVWSGQLGDDGVGTTFFVIPTEEEAS